MQSSLILISEIPPLAPNLKIALLVGGYKALSKFLEGTCLVSLESENINELSSLKPQFLFNGQAIDEWPPNI